MEKVNGISSTTRNNWIMDAGLFMSGVIAIASGIYFLFIPSGGYQGGRNPWYGVTVLFERETWEWLHTWIGLAMVVIALVHLLFHWKWIMGMFKRMANSLKGQGSGLNVRGRYNLALNATVALSFFVSAVSGIYFLIFGSSQGGRNPDPMILFARDAWDVIHTWSSILFIAALLLHFAIHWGWVTKVTRKVFGGKRQNSNTIVEPIKKENNMLKKALGTGLFVLVVGLLAFGGITRTYAANESEKTTALVGYEGYGNGFGGQDGSAGHGNSSDYGNGTYALDALPVGSLNQAEKDALLYMYEEEKLARDIYALFADLWDKPMFANISSAEQTHMDSVAALLDRYDLTSPGTDTSGTYSNTDLQVLYEELSTKGSTSLADAILVGGAIEELDILDLKERLELTDQADIQTVFANLLNGSYNHLNSFSAVYLVETGETYVPQYMTQADFDAIITEGTLTNSGYGSGTYSGNGFGGGGRGRR